MEPGIQAMIDYDLPKRKRIATREGSIVLMPSRMRGSVTITARPSPLGNDFGPEWPGLLRVQADLQVDGKQLRSEVVLDGEDLIVLTTDQATERDHATWEQEVVCRRRFLDGIEQDITVDGRTERLVNDQLDTMFAIEPLPDTARIHMSFTHPGLGDQRRCFVYDRPWESLLFLRYEKVHMEGDVVTGYGAHSQQWVNTQVIG